MINLLPITLDRDMSPTNVERVRRNHHDAIAELQRLAILRDNILTATLVDGGTTLIAHKLGRAPSLILISPVRGAASTGHIEEIHDGTFDEAKHIGLRSVGFGASVTVKALVI